MDTTDVESAMQRAIAAVGQPCQAHITDRNLMRATSDGWWAIGTVSVPQERKAWQVYYHPESGRGWLWGMRVLEKGVQPRPFVAPG